MTVATWSPGSLVRARGREWIVLTGSDPHTLRVRPVSGSEEDQTLIHLALEAEPVTEARFPEPRAHQQASHDAALLLRDALLLSLRRGAGPFRGFGQIAVEPRAYQLVPLLMALKLDPVRLLIADDVGVGKTIEAALIARELHDRGDVDRTTVLCPPHLVDQWVTELEERFHLRAAPVTAASANRLERGLPPGESIFSTHPHTVVSLDYIKSERRRSEFLRACPHFVIVDEAHTCAGAGRGRHQRYELLKGLSENPARHLVLLTATPHSGDEAAFYRLLGLLESDFEDLAEAGDDERRRLRERLSRHFVQRRRPDISEWREGELFPRRETKELTYKLTGAWKKLFDQVLDYCAEVVRSAGGDARRERLSFWGTLALMRCVASSPAAAVQALRTRAGLGDAEEEETFQDRLFDGDAHALVEDDVEPPAFPPLDPPRGTAANEDPTLQALIEQAEKLTGQKGDPKLKLLADHLAQLVAEGFNPVVFCRYPAAPGYRPVQRSHPLVSVLAETLLERTLGSAANGSLGGDGNGSGSGQDQAAADPGVLGRVGVWVSDDVEVRTTVALLRLRHQLVTHRPSAGSSSTLLVEEATAIAWAGVSDPSILEGTDAEALLAAPPVADPPAHVRKRTVARALEQLETRQADLDAFAERRAQTLLADHRRVREAAQARGSYAVKALLPTDVIGLFVLLPRMA